MSPLREARPQTPLIDVVDELRFEFSGVPARTIVHYLRRAAAELCREADLCRQRQAIVALPGVEAYAREPMGDVEVASILEAVEADTRRPIPRSPREPAGFPGPVCWLVPPDEIHIRSGSARPKAYEIEYSTVPGPMAATIDSDLASRHRSVLQAGVRSMLYAVGGKPWSNPDLAELHRRAFIGGGASAKADAARGRQKGILRVRNERVL
jgi:hypothetical protein